MKPHQVGRTWIIPVLIAIFIGAWILDRHSVEILSYWTGIPMEQIGDRGVEPAQQMGIGLYKLCFGIVTCAGLATLTERMVRVDGTNGISRWLILFVTYLYCFSQLAR